MNKCRCCRCGSSHWSAQFLHMSCHLINPHFILLPCSCMIRCALLCTNSVPDQERCQGFCSTCCAEGALFSAVLTADLHADDHLQQRLALKISNLRDCHLLEAKLFPEACAAFLWPQGSAVIALMNAGQSSPGWHKWLGQWASISSGLADRHDMHAS